MTLGTPNEGGKRNLFGVLRVPFECTNYNFVLFDDNSLTYNEKRHEHMSFGVGQLSCQ